MISTSCAENDSTLDLAAPRAVEGVRDVGAEELQLQVLRPATDLLVDRERDAHRSRAARPDACEPRDGAHDLRHPGLVVRAQQRRAVAGDQIVTDARGELGMLLRVEHEPRVAREHDRTSVVEPVHHRLHPAPRGVG